MSEIKALLINGSPHKEGISMTLAKHVINALNKNGAELKIIHLHDQEIKPCKGCATLEPEKCNLKTCTEGELKDSMVELFPLLLESDILVLVTPVWWFAPSGLLKNFIDRLTCLENQGKLLDGKVAGFVATGKEDGAMQSIMPLMATLNDMGFIFPPYAFTYSVGFLNVEEDEDAIQYARFLGENLVKMARLVKGEKWWKGKILG